MLGCGRRRQPAYTCSEGRSCHQVLLGTFDENPCGGSVIERDHGHPDLFRDHLVQGHGLGEEPPQVVLCRLSLAAQYSQIIGCLHP